MKSEIDIAVLAGTSFPLHDDDVQKPSLDMFN